MKSFEYLVFRRWLGSNNGWPNLHGTQFEPIWEKHEPDFTKYSQEIDDAFLMEGPGAQMKQIS